MNPVVLLLGGAATVAGVWYFKKHHTASPPSLLTPPRAAVHGHLMANEYRPDKLEHMASLFGAEGLPEQARELQNKAEQIRLQATAVAELCERARGGDQNAMGMLAGVREQAEAGNPRAQVSRALAARYCAANPMPDLGPLGETAIADGAEA